MLLFTESSVKINITAGGKKYEASIPVEHCPSNSGCRAIVKQADGNTIFNITDNFTIEFTVKNNTSYVYKLYVHDIIFIRI